MNLKKYLPFENYTLTTNLSSEEVTKRLADNMEPKKTFRFSGFTKSIKLYEGQISGDNFTISRIINYRNSFLPVITGNISTFLGKTQIDVKMRLKTFVKVFLGIWFILVGVVCLGIILAGLIYFQKITHEGFPPIMLAPFAMFFLFWLMATLAFKWESKKSKLFLKELLEGEEAL